MSLENEITRLESYIPMTHEKDDKVSRQSVGWHIHHSLKVIHSVLKTIEGTDPSKYKWKFNLNRMIFLTIGWFPRGQAKAPKLVLPPDVISEEAIMDELDAVKNLLSVLQSAPRNSYFKHPYFGYLNLPSAKHFLSVHSRHHLKIIKDILGH